MIVIAASVHVVIGVYFFFLQIPFMVWMSLLDIAIYAVAFLVNKSGRVRLANFLLVGKITSFAILSTFLFGLGVNAHWMVLAATLPAALYLDFSKVQRIWIFIIMAVVINIQIAMPFFVEVHPLYMPDDVVLPFFYGNVVYAAFFASVLVNAIITRRITDRQAKEIEDFQHASHTDPLTQISNRRYAEVYFNKLTAEKQDIPFTFALFDIDNFKNINDTFGHDAGDKVLAAIADVLRLITRHGDLVCRWGGEEFLVGLPGCDQETGFRTMEKIRRSIEETCIDIDTQLISVTITGGGALLLDGNIKAALQTCDKNLYEGKRNGKNQIIF